MNTANNSSLKADLSLFIVAAIWGSGFVASKLAVDSGMSTGMIMALRFTIAALVLLLFFRKKILGASLSDYKYGAPAGILLFLAFFSQTLGIRFTTPSNNAFLTATNVIMVPFITWLMLRKPPKIKSFLLTFVCLSGIAVLTWTPGTGIEFNAGDILTLACAFLFACHISYLDIASKKMDVNLLTFVQMAVAALLSIASLLILPARGYRI